MASFAVVDDLIESWRPLSDDEVLRADYLLGKASRMVRARWGDIDERIDTGELDADVVSDVVLEMVQGAMAAPLPGVTQQSETTGPFSQSLTFANPAGNLYFTKGMITLLGGDGPRAVVGWLA